MSFKEKVEAFQSIVTIAAIIVGGIWTYNTFIKERKGYPHANIEQKVSHISLPDSKNLVRHEIELINEADIILKLTKSMIRIQQILPIVPCNGNKPCANTQMNDALKITSRKEDRFSWPLLSKRYKSFDPPLEIEPGEKEIMDFEFVIPQTVKVIRVYTYFRNDQKTKDKNEIGWSISTIYDLRPTNKKAGN